MPRPEIHGLPYVLAVLLVLAGCDRTPVCDFSTAASSDGKTRIALLVNASSGALQSVSGALESLQFPAGNICTLSGEAASADVVRQAVDEVASQSNANAIRFVYIAAEGSVVLDDNADEPDEYDETLLFADADGSGKGEVRDDELQSWLGTIGSRSSGSVFVLNVGVYSAGLNGTTNPSARNDLPRSRSLGDDARDGGDGAAWLHDGGGENHVVLAPGPGAAGARFDERIVDMLAQVGVHTPTYAQLAQRFSFHMHADGLAPDARGTGTGNVFELYRSKLVPLGLDETDITVGVRNAGRPGGLTPGHRAEMENIVAALDGISIAEAGALADFEVSQRNDGVFVVRGPGGRARNAAAALEDLSGILRGHRIQKQLANLRGNDSETIPDQHTLDVFLRRYSQQLPCARGVWDQAPAGAVQDIPLCFAWYTEVDNQNDSVPLHLTLLVLSSDGSTLAIPGTAARAISGPVAFDAGSQVVGAGPPIDVVDQLLVIGSTEPIDINGLLRGDAAAPDGSRWTISTRFFRTVANNGFLSSDELSQREYTIKNFDIRPYLPDDDTTALSRFLRQADQLAKSSIEDGYSYKQHGWRHATDEQNLAEGIDCSRSIWFAFTRAGLPFNDGDRYLTTADMVAPSSRMAGEFDECPLDEDYRVGDILVYRSDERGDGHVVAVIDIEKRIAWGSHGWDGNVNAGLALEPDTGVEYQKIRVKQDWQRWDRSDMTLRKCWRYREFAEELEDGRGSAGSRILGTTCSESECQL